MRKLRCADGQRIGSIDLSVAVGTNAQLRRLLHCQSETASCCSAVHTPCPPECLLYPVTLCALTAEM